MKRTLVTIAAVLYSCSCSPGPSESTLKNGRASTHDAGDPRSGEGATGGDGGLDGATGTGPRVVGNTSVVYAPDRLDNEELAGNRVLRLHHAGGQNGELLAVFEHDHVDGTPSPLIVRRSTDDGETWSTAAMLYDGEKGPDRPGSYIYQPIMFEFPTAIAGYPEGTLVLVANVIPHTASETHFQQWRSVDHGATWTYETMFQAGGPSPQGIWEPFLFVDSTGRLACVFADERQSSTHSQMLSEVVSTDGGQTWSANPDGTTRFAPGLIAVTRSDSRPERPGMPTIAKLPDGTYVMVYEFCGSPNPWCEVHTKRSVDGITWGSGPADKGTRIETTDGRYLAGGPYITWDDAAGQLLLTGGQPILVGGTTVAPEKYQFVMLNTHGGEGPWSWMPAPIEIAHEGGEGHCNPNYNSHLLPSVDGRVVRHTAASQGAGVTCANRSTTANAGVLPYESPFQFGNAAGWRAYGGCWAVTDGVFRNTCETGGGNKALAGSTGWTDVVLEADVRLDARGQAGLLVRLSNPAVGIDAHRGYFVGLADGLFLGRQNYDWTQLAVADVAGGVEVGSWYHLNVRAIGCDFSVEARRAGSTAVVAKLQYSDPGCTMRAGAIGVRDVSANASFRNITVHTP